MTHRTRVCSESSACRCSNRTWHRRDSSISPRLLASDADNHHATCHQWPRRRHTEIGQWMPVEGVAGQIPVQVAIGTRAVPPAAARHVSAVVKIFVVVLVAGWKLHSIHQLRPDEVERVSGVTDAGFGHVYGVVVAGRVYTECSVFDREPSSIKGKTLRNFRYEMTHAQFHYFLLWVPVGSSVKPGAKVCYTCHFTWEGPALPEPARFGLADTLVYILHRPGDVYDAAFFI